MSDNPQIRDEYSPLSALITQALRRFGDFSPHSVQGEVGQMFLEFANLVVDDINRHPYAEELYDEPVEYYTQIDQARAIPDVIMRQGLLLYYSEQQHSSKLQTASPHYYEVLNGKLYQLYSGGSPKLRMQVVDREDSTDDEGV